MRNLLERRQRMPDVPPSKLIPQTPHRLQGSPRDQAVIVKRCVSSNTIGN